MEKEEIVNNNALKQNGKVKSPPGRHAICTQLHISFVFFCIYTAYKCLESMQSSLNFEDGLGTISISLVYGGYFISSLVIGAPVMHLLSPKWALFGTLFSNTIFVLANFWPIWATMIPASLVLGLAAGPYWIAQGTYTTVLALEYTKATQKNPAHVISIFSSIFHVMWGFSGPTGNLAASVVLGFNKPKNDFSNCSQGVIGINTSLDANELSLNYSHSGTANLMACGSEPNLDLCGPRHCPYIDEHIKVLEKPSQMLLNILMGVLLGFNVIGLVLMAFVRNVTSTRQTNLCQSLLTTFSILKEPTMILLILPFCFIGVIPGTFYGSFAQSYISCAFGVDMVGYAIMCEGAGFTVASMFFGPLTKCVSRPILSGISYLLFAGIAIGWLNWHPQRGQFWLVVIIAFVYGAMHGIQRTHVAALVSLLFPDKPEAGFAQYNLWIAVACSVCFAYTTFLCFHIKIYIFLVCLLLTATTYFVLEFRIKKMNHPIITQHVIHEVLNDKRNSCTKL